MDVAVRVDHRDIARPEPAVLSELLRRLFGHAPVAAEDVGAAHLQAADLAGGERCALVAHDAQINARQGKAHRSRPPFTIIGVRRIHAGFRHAIALEDRVPGARAELLEGLGEKRRGAGSEEPHVRHGLAAEIVARKKPRVKGRHTHEGRGTGKLADHVLAVELPQPDHLRARKQGTMAGNEEAMGMEDGKRMKEDIRLREAPCIAKGNTVGGEIAMREHRPFRFSRRTGSVEDRREVAGTANNRLIAFRHTGSRVDEASARFPVEREEMRRPAARAYFPQGGFDGRIADHERGFGIADEIIDLVSAIGHIHRQENKAAAQAGEIDSKRFRRFFDLKGNAVSARKSEPHKKSRIARYRRQQIVEGPDARAA